MKDWIDFKKSFTQQQEDALWQYFIDHSILETSTFFRISFGVRDVDDFWKRVYARYTGEFSRYNKLEKAQKQQQTAHNFEIARNRKHAEITNRIDASGSLWERLILWLHRKTKVMIYGEKPHSFKELKNITK